MYRLFSSCANKHTTFKIFETVFVSGAGLDTLLRWSVVVAEGSTQQTRSTLDNQLYHLHVVRRRCAVQWSPTFKRNKLTFRQEKLQYFSTDTTVLQYVYYWYYSTDTAGTTVRILLVLQYGYCWYYSKDTVQRSPTFKPNKLRFRQEILQYFSTDTTVL